MAEIKRVKYFTKDKEKFILPNNQKLYDKYLQSNILKNPDVKSTTYNVYSNYFKQFLIWLGENYKDLGLYDEEFMTDAVDILEGYMAFCQSELNNHKKIINTKLSAISSFYIWSAKRGLIKYHPFQNKLDRMKKAQDEHILTSYFLNKEQIEEIRKSLYAEDSKWELQDKILFEVSLFSGNRIGALEKLTLSSLNLEEMVFENIREKEGYRVSVPFENTCKDMIETWLSMRHDNFDKLQCDALFIHKVKDETYEPLKRGALYQRMVKFGKIIGIEDFRPHCMRKTCINQIYEESGDLNLASQWANHKSSAVTQASYIKPVSKADLRKKLMDIKKNNKE